MIRANSKLSPINVDISTKNFPDTILQGLIHVQFYIDNVLITGDADEEHFHSLQVVHKQLKQHGKELFTIRKIDIIFDLGAGGDL